jgi:ribosomal protein S18 acetylase RimI-like enzyme
MTRQVAFREMVRDDLVTLFNWLARPHVKRWYSTPPASFAEVAAKYGPRVEEGSPVRAFIIQADEADAGYIQAYSIDEFPDYERATGCEKGVLGVDLFIADDWRTRHGLGPLVLRRFVEDILFGGYGAIAVVAGPLEGNTAAIRAFEKAGFRRWKVITNERGEKECLLRIDRDTADYRIEPIDLIDADTCVAFRRDMYIASFGTDEGLEEEMGPQNEHYLEQLRARMAELPEGNAHLWHGERIVGQLEMHLLENEPHVAYVSLVYVEPGARGHGLGRRMHEHASIVSRERGKRLMRLSVSLTNVPAIMFYRRLGWEMKGTRAHRLPMAIMEFALQ